MQDNSFIELHLYEWQLAQDIDKHQIQPDIQFPNYHELPRRRGNTSEKESVWKRLGDFEYINCSTRINRIMNKVFTLKMPDANIELLDERKISEKSYKNQRSLPNKPSWPEGVDKVKINKEITNINIDEDFPDILVWKPGNLNVAVSILLEGLVDLNIVSKL